MVLLLSGCASAPDIISTEKAPDQKYSDADVRYMTVDQPYMVSGEYFRERKQEPGLDLGKIFAKSEKVEKEQVDLESRVAQLEQQTAAGRVAAAPAVQPAPGASTPAPAVMAAAPAAALAGEQMKIKVGLLIDQRQVQGDGARLLTNAAYLNSARFPIVPVSPGEIGESLSQQKELNPNDLAQVSRVLAVYPGVRMLVLIEKFQLPETYPGQALAVVNLVDSGILHRYPPMEVAMPLSVEADAARFADSVVSTAFDQAISRSGLMPWFCRAFSHEEQVWYINAGKDSGLKTGDRLKVVSGGKLVKAPSGIPAGWIPGTPKGTLKVDLYFGQDLAACSLVDGNGPEGGDLLMK
jgi:hypothetical protein